MTLRNIGLAVALIASATSATSVPAFAKAETVTVTGDYPDQRITAPVRHTAVGDQVYLRHAGWISCAADCRKALKDARFDFWTVQDENLGGHGKGH